MSIIDRFKDRFKTYEGGVLQSGVVAGIFNFFQGRATAFAIVFTIVGVKLAFMGKLDANYALFVTAIQGLVFAHSCKEDWHEQRMAAIQQTTVDVNVAAPVPPVVPPVVPPAVPVVDPSKG